MNEALKYFLAFIIYLLAQVLLFDKLSFQYTAPPFVFILFLITLPLSLPTPFLYIIAFITGLGVDIFSDIGSIGLHTFSSVLVVTLRSFILKLNISSNFRSLDEITFVNQSAIWWASYLFPLILVYHLSYNLLEAHSFFNIFYRILEIFASTAYTFVICFFLSYLFYKR